MVPVFSDIDHRNGMFALLIAMLPLVAGSFSTALFFAAAAALLVEFGPLGSVRVGRDALREQPALWLLVVFFVYVSAACLLGNNPMRGLEFVGGYLHFPIALLFIGWLRKLSPEIDYIGFFVWGCRLGVPIAFAIGLWQFLLGDARVEGASVNALLYALLCITAGSLSVLNVQGDGKPERIVAWAGLLLGTAGVLMSFSRGIWLMLPVMYLLVAVYFARLRTLSIGQVVIALLVVMNLMVALTLTPYGAREMQDRIVDPLQQARAGVIEDTSIHHRLDLLETGWQAFLNRPLIGHGMQNTVAAADDTSPAVLGRQTHHTYTHLHNDYLTHAVGGGAPLAVMFAMMLMLPLWLAVRAPRDRIYQTRLYFAAILSVGYAGAALTNLVFRHDLPQTFFMCGVIFVAISVAQSENGVDRPTLWSNKPQLVPG